ncbi:MAG: hypothetical protein HY059_22020 [Proteobacteria bacterium]|nr:hypothetical protein [Pseudomonadota bacterium]
MAVDEGGWAEAPEGHAGALPVGVYDRLVTRRISGELAGLDHRGLVAELSRLDPAELPHYVSRHVADVLRSLLEARPDAAARAAVATAVLDLLHEHAGDGDPDQRLADDLPEPLLRAVQPRVEGPGRRRMPHPVLAVGQSDLLINARGEPSLLHSLRGEIASADRIDAVVAFIRYSGVRPLLSSLDAALGRGARVRILTTTYLGGSDARAIRRLAEMGAEVRVSYQLDRTRLHAKGWFFERDTGFHTAYIGSSNLSATAMTLGQEWNVRLAAAQAPDLVEKFRAAFDSYWDDPALRHSA